MNNITYTREELFFIFTTSTLKKLYCKHIDKTGTGLNSLTNYHLATHLQGKVAKPPSVTPTFIVGDLVVDLEGVKYRFIRYNSSTFSFILRQLESGLKLVFNSIIFKIQPIGISELLPLDLQDKLKAIGSLYNYIFLEGRILEIADLYVLDEEDAYRIINSEIAKTKEGLIKLLDY